MKIGILTFHCAHNYGAVLQCYALQEYITSLGHKVEIIDYQPKYLLKPYSIYKFNKIICKNPIQFIKNIIWEIIQFYYRRKRHSNFDSFIKNRLNLSQKIRQQNIPNHYDIYIIGYISLVGGQYGLYKTI